MVHESCRAGLACNTQCTFNGDDFCCGDATDASLSQTSWTTCSNPSVVLDEAIVTFSRKTDERTIATATFGIEWDMMSPIIERVTTSTSADQAQVKSCTTLGWLTKMGSTVCGLVVDMDNGHYTPVENFNRYSSPSKDTCAHGSMIDAKDAGWCAPSPREQDIIAGHVTMDLLKAETVVGVVTQGRKSGEYVTGIKVAYSVDGNDYKFIVDSQNQEIVFAANGNNVQKAFIKFSTAILARYVRVHPWGYGTLPAMRVGVMLKEAKLSTVYTQCIGSRTFDNAKAYCESLGGRLCSSKEVLSTHTLWHSDFIASTTYITHTHTHIYIYIFTQ